VALAGPKSNTYSNVGTWRAGWVASARAIVRCA